MKKASSIGNIKDPNLVNETPVLRWERPGHATVIEVVYGALPDDVKKNLELEQMKIGIRDPDNKFHDTISHHYPPTYKKATKWLDEGKNSYDKKDYEHASYCFGVAAHYISDTFVAPHCVDHEKGTDHHKFEKIGDDLTPEIIPVKGDLDTLLKNGFIQGQLDWKKWMKNKKDSSAVQDEMNHGVSVAVFAIENSLK